MRLTRSTLMIALLAFPAGVLAQESSRLDVRVVADQADAALVILEKRSTGRAVEEADWQRLFATEAFRRLEARARAFGGEVDRDAFRRWLTSDSVASKVAGYREAIVWWKALDPQAPARKALAYLPDDAFIHAKVYPVIKPQTNSFVFELETDPAIFFYVDPDQNPSKRANTLAHELHHVGTAAVENCEPEDVGSLSEGAQRAIDWLGGFHEGLAVLAAAGGPDVHPHADRDPQEYAAWERDIARVNEDLIEINRFLLDLAEGRLTDEEEARRAGLRFIGREGVPQGPFYTVGWKMAAVVEKVEGRETVVGAICDPRALLRSWNRLAAGLDGPEGREFTTWSQALMTALGVD